MAVVLLVVALVVVAVVVVALVMVVGHEKTAEFSRGGKRQSFNFGTGTNVSKWKDS